MALHSRTELEEERRLFYVAVTRAKDTCTLSFATSRFIWGNLVTAEPSRFIDEIDQKFLNFISPERRGGRSLNSRPTKFDKPYVGGLNKTVEAPSGMKSVSKSFSSSSSSNKGAMGLDLKVGYNVEHAQFGKGKITAITGEADDKKATIFFLGKGAKTLLLRFANLNVLED